MPYFPLDKAVGFAKSGLSNGIIHAPLPKFNPSSASNKYQFVDGNHENFDRLYGGEFEVVDFHGGKAHKIAENIYHLIRGYVFELCGKKFFAFGGAGSHDIADGILDKSDYTSPKDFQKTYKAWQRAGKQFRINHESWWSQELPDKEDLSRGRKNLAEHGNRVDFVISHCLPQALTHFLPGSGGDTNVLTDYFDDLMENGLQFGAWYCGHYHMDRWLTDQFCILYHNIIMIPTEVLKILDAENGGGT